jgi:hypothetical protein
MTSYYLPHFQPSDAVFVVAPQHRHARNLTIGFRNQCFA